MPKWMAQHLCEKYRKFIDTKKLTNYFTSNWCGWELVIGKKIMLVVGSNNNQYKFANLTVVKNILKFLVSVNIVKIKLKNTKTY